MSKIIDALQKRFGTVSAADIPQPAPATQSDRVAARHQIHEQLADVYFQNPKQIAEDPQTAFHAPTVVRVVDRSRSYFLPWLITLLALALSTFALFSTKRVAIDIRITDAASAKPAAVPADASSAASSDAVDASRLIPEVVSMNPSDFIFSGAALLRSSREKQQLVLTNSSVSGLAYAHAVFNPPLPALGKRLYLEARGMKGGEKFEIVFKDANGNTSLNWKSIVPFADGVSAEWQPVIVDFEPSRFFNPNAIEQMRIEFGTQRTGNVADAAIMIRNIQWIPAEPSGV